jgi:hypothetical protein
MPDAVAVLKDDLAPKAESVPTPEPVAVLLRRIILAEEDDPVPAESEP